MRLASFLPSHRRFAPLAAGLLAAALTAAAAPLLETAPLAARSGPRGATLFAPLAAESTGIVTDNKYDDPKMWGPLYNGFVYGSSGCGVAIGDYDNDGRPDVFVVSKTGRSRLFRNRGNWAFEDVTDRAGLPGGTSSGWMKGLLGGGSALTDPLENWKQGATFADVNNDGRLDLYVCRFGAPNWLFINQGDGTFKEEAAARGLALVDSSVISAFHDYDRDGWLDVYVATNLLDNAKHPAGQPDHLFHNRGDGTFEDVTVSAGLHKEDTSAHSVTWWDYDNDGWPDLYVANDYAVPDYLYHNNRDGTFTDVITQVVPRMPHSSMGADLGDVNGDGRLDFFVADMAPTTHEKDQRGMAQIRVLLHAGDYDDLPSPPFMRNALYLNTGTGRMREAAQLAGIARTDWTWSPRFEDLDNDGRVDLHATTGMVREFHNQDTIARTMGIESFDEKQRVIRATPPMAEPNLVYRNLGDLRFEECGAAWGLNQNTVSFGAAFGDLDGDGDLDLVVANYEAGATVLRNDSDSGHRAIVALRGVRSNRFGLGATVRIETTAGPQIRQLVVARGYCSSSEPVAHFGLGDDTTIRHLTVEWPGGAVQTFDNLPADRRFTITEPAAAPPPATAAATTSPQFVDVSTAQGLAVESREGPFAEGRAQALIPFRFSRRGPALATGDLDGDGRDEFVLGGTSAEPARVLHSNAAGGFSAAPIGASAGGLPNGPILVFDANGHPAVFATKAGVAKPNGALEYQPQLWLNDGTGTLHAAPADALPPLPLSVGALAAADFDHDGQLDVFVGARLQPGRYPLSPRSALLASRGGRFEDVTDSVAPALRDVGLVTSALWSDVDGDGWSDLLVATEWGQVHYFHNNAGTGFEDRTEAAGFATAGTGWWTAIASADLNGDSRPDYAVGNAGLNTPYSASPAEPALLYYGDFGGSGAPALVEAEWDHGKLYPRRTRKSLGAAIPPVLKRFPKNNDFAKATLGEVLGEARLSAARRFAATELRSGVFLSQPDGSTYRFTPLPRIAQIGATQGLVAGDFDGDGNADLYLLHNSYAPQPDISRFDGGLSLLLRGDGRGNFTPVEPVASGLIVTGDAKALVVTDLDADGWPDFVATRNNGATVAFRNQRVAGRRMLRIALRGPAGNPTAIGARVTLVRAGGSTQTGELAAGGGYWSQSSAALHFGYPEADPPQELRIVWPDGTRSNLPCAGAQAIITLAQP